jgi:hypothetical protein
MRDRPRPELVILALTFIGSSGSPYIENLQLKVKLAELLYWGTVKGLFVEVLNTNAFALDWTFPNVLSFYIGELPIYFVYTRGGKHQFSFTVR